MIRSYEDLDVYRRSYRLALEINELCKKLPRSELHGLSSQLRRASRSVPSNIAEGFGRKVHPKEFQNFLLIALGSNDEVIFNIKFMKDASYYKFEEELAKNLFSK
ncbi:hypothetical protein A3B18_04110 [Candidatus Giovannonibacteria bacterium RIFCSPLOWO2_01_FULL_46_13]|uniref:Four helix bundle protein n=1 Tax=Candidatus Giovannonibacteria bacterium RIFCSPLOWO2_01_FULL_46_13 TaxID=1798352 RepID=A0A1F5X2T0_9BACT|nr:MAG: hypothetical protein A3B18_04110 [Candidatus Giovannonibacteria bacterium RIFCSPLOWO2_01_FULL_46_13]